jgi:hypothetical protein
MFRPEGITQNLQGKRHNRCSKLWIQGLVSPAVHTDCLESTCHFGQLRRALSLTMVDHQTWSDADHLDVSVGHPCWWESEPG